VTPALPADELRVTVSARLPAFSFTVAVAPVRPTVARSLSRMVTVEPAGVPTVEPLAGLLRVSVKATEPLTFFGSRIGMLKVLVAGSPCLKKIVPCTGL
jgi:hypothetical protein